MNQAATSLTRTADNQARRLLERYWRVPVRQMETSVVLANASFEAAMGEPPTGNQFIPE